MKHSVDILTLRSRLEGDIFTSAELNDLLAEYRNKAAKISLLLSRQEIVPLRRGLYTFHPSLRRGPLSSEALANRIYGPSYVSEDFALAHYGLIPETPQAVTSITMKRSRSFTNPCGIFHYRYCQSQAYPLGLCLAGEGEARHLIAMPLKALFDKALYDTRWDGECPEAYLTEDLRIDLDEPSWLDRELLSELAPFMRGRLKRLLIFLEGLP